MPTIGALMSGPNLGDVTIMIRTVASGINNTQQNFRFIIAPMTGGVKGSEIVFPFPDYQSGHFETVTIENLPQGKSYIFYVAAANIFARSEPSYSPLVVLQGLSCNIVLITICYTESNGLNSLIGCQCQNLVSQ